MASVVSTGPLLTLVYTGEPDVVHEYTHDGQRRVFGRDDSCDVVIWSAINGTRLSARAGVVWRMDDELWVRNLSTAHDLYVEVPGMPPEPPLPPRSDERDRGAARSLPADLAYVRGPDGCELRIRQLHVPPVDGVATGPPLGGRVAAAAPSTAATLAGRTTRLPAIPPDLRRVALALCEPLFAGSQLPASYTQIGARTAVASRKSVRNAVERLTDLYLQEVPALRDVVQARLDRDATRLGLVGAPHVVRGGVVRFDTPDLDLVDAAEAERRSALALPTYYEVAHLLVRRHLVTEQDVAELEGPG